jgi:hypothetical protein
MWEEQKSDPLASAARGPFFVLPTLRLFCSSHVILCIGPKKCVLPVFLQGICREKVYEPSFFGNVRKNFFTPPPRSPTFLGKNRAPAKI